MSRSLPPGKAVPRPQWISILACLAMFAPAANAQKTGPQSIWDEPLLKPAAVALRADSIARGLLATFPAVTRTTVNRELEGFARTVNSGAAERVRSAAFLNAGYDDLALL